MLPLLVATFTATVVGHLAIPLSAWADSTRWKLAVEGGSEYDSNLHRIEVANDERVEGGALLRTGAAAQVAWVPKKGKALTTDFRAASKLFANAAGQSENVGVIYADAKFQSYWGESKAILGIRGNYYDALDLRPFGDGENPVGGRSFRAREAELSLQLPSEGEHRITALANTRAFVYKPDADFNWTGEHVGLRYQNLWWIGDPDKDENASSLDIRMNYKVGLRRYEGVAFRNACSSEQMASPECFVPTLGRRTDMNHTGLAEAVYTGRNIYSLLYGAQFVDSNSYGQASLRQRLEVSITTELPAKVFLTAQATLRLNTFLDPLLLARDVQSQTFVSIEDENRNSLKLDFARDIGESMALEARLAIYSNEFATQELKFRRQTAYFGLVYRISDE